jgi:hypothetical protein
MFFVFPPAIPHKLLAGIGHKYPQGRGQLTTDN